MNEQDITLSYHEIIRACGDDADWLGRLPAGAHPPRAPHQPGL